MQRTIRVRVLAGALLVLGALIALGATGWPGTIGGAGSDCETVRAGVLAQPVAAWTSLAFVAGGVWAAGYRPAPLPFRALLAGALATVGLASFAGHAAATDWAHTADSLAIKAMLVLFITYPLFRRTAEPARPTLITVAVVAAVWIIELAVPAAGRPLLVALGAVAVLVALGAGYRPAVMAGLALLGAGALFWWLGRSAGPLCEPDSALQLHGMWHILAATGLLTIYRGMT